MFKIVATKGFSTSGGNKLTDLAREGITRKLRLLADTFLEEIAATAPVSTGQFLANFHVGDETKAATLPPPGPKAWKRGNKFDPSIEEQNRQRAIDIMFSNYDRQAFNDPYRRFYIVNNAPHARDLEYGGPKDFTNGVHRGIIASALQKAVNAAKLRK